MTEQKVDAAPISFLKRRGFEIVLIQPGGTQSADPDTLQGDIDWSYVMSPAFASASAAPPSPVSPGWFQSSFSRVVSRSPQSPQSSSQIQSQPLASPTKLSEGANYSPLRASFSSSSAESLKSPSRSISGHSFDTLAVTFTNERFLPLLRELKRLQHRDEVCHQAFLSCSLFTAK